MASSDPPSVPELQRRIDAALKTSPADRARSNFSEYLPERSMLPQRLMQAATAGGSAGIAAALDECERLAATEDPLRLQRALSIFLTHHPDAARLGLRVPSLAERAPWKVVPSRPRPAK